MATSRYSKVSRRVWGDLKFTELSAPQPNAQTLWFRLLTGPELTNIPGLFSARESGLAEALGWPLEAFRKAFREVSERGMAKADWKHGLVWVPKAMEHNRPESPNVVIGWATLWVELPECSLKDKAFQALKAFAESLGEAYGKAFRKAFGEGSPNQEQEQEPEQEQDTKIQTREAPESNHSVPIHPAKKSDQSFETLCPERIIPSERTKRLFVRINQLSDVKETPAEFYANYRSKRIGKGIKAANPAGWQADFESYCDSWLRNLRAKQKSGPSPVDPNQPPFAPGPVRAFTTEEDRQAERIRRGLVDP